MSAASEVVVAGAGVAGAATAIRLRALGFGVRILVRPGRRMAGIEAVPQPALGLLEILGVPDLLAEAGGVEVAGPGHDAVHVDRDALARTGLARAVDRGAVVEVVRRLPPVREVLPPAAVAAIDATGRAAAWSRPVVGGGHAVVWQFEGPPDPGNLALHAVVERDWWAYRLGTPSTTWAGVASADDDPVDEALHRLRLDPGAMAARGRRAARVQRAGSPVAGRRIAVGDAAMTHDPIAGGGIRFALASAVAAGTTVATWADDPARADLASAYYDELVKGEHRRHLETLDTVRAGPARAAPGRQAPSVVRFAAPVVDATVVVDGRVRPGPAVRLPDGTFVRWLGAFDLLVLARLAERPVPRIALLARLQEAGLDAGAARAVVGWASQRGVLVGD